MQTDVFADNFNTPEFARWVRYSGEHDLVPRTWKSDPIAAGVTMVAAAGILLATLHSGGHSTSNEWGFNLASGDAALAELLQNLILFVPFGIGLALLGVPWRWAVAAGTLLSLSVEFTQQWVPGRDPNVGDIVSNTISTAIGVALVRFAPRWLTVSPERSAWHALAAAGLAVLVWFGTAALLEPTFGPSPYTVLARPDFNYWGRYRGDILEARLKGGRLYIKATFPERPPRRPSPLAAVVDGRGKLATILAVDGRDLSMRYDMPSLKLTLEHPDLRWEDALAKVGARDTFMAATGHEGSSTLCLSVLPDYRCNLGYTIGDGWRLIFNPEHWPGWVLAFINACWVAGWTVGVGFWAGRTSGGEGRRRAARAAVAIVLVAMIVVPMTTHLKGSSLVEWIGALVGIELGLIAGSRTWNELMNRPT